MCQIDHLKAFTALSTASKRFEKLSYPKQLTTSFDRTVQYASSSPEAFRECWEMFMSHDVLPDFEIESVSGDYAQDMSRPYLHSGNCFRVIETYKSSKTLNAKPKVGTFIQCAFCDTFKSCSIKETSNQNRVINGEPIAVSGPFTNFYDTTNTHYVHHMADAHGVTRTGVVAEPMLGFTIPKHYVAELSIVCPHTHNREACLAKFPFNFNGDSGFKAYYRHVKQEHKDSGEIKLLPKTQRLSTDEAFVPVDTQRWFDQLAQMASGMGVGIITISGLFNLLCTEETQKIVEKALQSIAPHKTLKPKRAPRVRSAKKNYIKKQAVVTLDASNDFLNKADLFNLEKFIESTAFLYEKPPQQESKVVVDPVLTINDIQKTMTCTPEPAKVLEMLNKVNPMQESEPSPITEQDSIIQQDELIPMFEEQNNAIQDLFDEFYVSD